MSASLKEIAARVKDGRRQDEDAEGGERGRLRREFLNAVGPLLRTRRDPHFVDPVMIATFPVVSDGVELRVKGFEEIDDSGELTTPLEAETGLYVINPEGVDDEPLICMGSFNLHGRHIIPDGILRDGVEAFMVFKQQLEAHTAT
ncbi:MAG: hypothetical protein ACHQT7_00700 [Candidatus Levyibacteriota bacterium]